MAQESGVLLLAANQPGEDPGSFTCRTDDPVTVYPGASISLTKIVMHRSGIFTVPAPGLSFRFKIAQAATEFVVTIPPGSYQSGGEIAQVTQDAMNAAFTNLSNVSGTRSTELGCAWYVSFDATTDPPTYTFTLKRSEFTIPDLTSASFNGTALTLNNNGTFSKPNTGNDAYDASLNSIPINCRGSGWMVLQHGNRARQFTVGIVSAETFDESLTEDISATPPAQGTFLGIVCDGLDTDDSLQLINGGLVPINSPRAGKNCLVFEKRGSEMRIYTANKTGPKAIADLLQIAAVNFPNEVNQWHTTIQIKSNDGLQYTYDFYPDPASVQVLDSNGAQAIVDVDLPAHKLEDAPQRTPLELMALRRVVSSAFNFPESLLREFGLSADPPPSAHSNQPYTFKSDVAPRLSSFASPTLLVNVHNLNVQARNLSTGRPGSVVAMIPRFDLPMLQRAVYTASRPLRIKLGYLHPTVVNQLDISITDLSNNRVEILPGSVSLLEFHLDTNEEKYKGGQG